MTLDRRSGQRRRAGFRNGFLRAEFGGRRTGSCTELLRTGVTLTVDDTYRGNPEPGVAGVMRRRGYRVFFAENALWHSLFGCCSGTSYSSLIFFTAVSIGCRTASMTGASRIGLLPRSTTSWRPFDQDARSIFCPARSPRNGAVRTASSRGTTSMPTRCGCCCREPAVKGSQPSSACCAGTSATCATVPGSHAGERRRRLLHGD